MPTPILIENTRHGLFLDAWLNITVNTSSQSLSLTSPITSPPFPQHDTVLPIGIFTLNHITYIHWYILTATLIDSEFNNLLIINVSINVLFMPPSCLKTSHNAFFTLMIWLQFPYFVNSPLSLSSHFLLLRLTISLFSIKVVNFRPQKSWVPWEIQFGRRGLFEYGYYWSFHIASCLHCAFGPLFAFCFQLLPPLCLFCSSHLSLPGMYHSLTHCFDCLLIIFLWLYYSCLSVSFRFVFWLPYWGLEPRIIFCIVCLIAISAEYVADCELSFFTVNQVHERYVMRLRRKLQFEEKKQANQRRVILISFKKNVIWILCLIYSIWGGKS